MATIYLTTFIAAPLERVFDLSRHLALYKNVFSSRKEKFSSGAGANLLTKGDTLSILARHAGKTRLTMLKIADLQKPSSFTEEQVKGDLKNYHHEHHFKAADNGTIIIDMLNYGSPKDIVGRIIGRIYLKKYFEELIQRRNEQVRMYAESEKWRAVLS